MMQFVKRKNANDDYRHQDAEETWYGERKEIK